ncbi:anaerobic ribonucleoside triphosphate reductase [uncultured Ruminococcus sp.]|uniref:Ribonucleoside-triphosphate reductase n=1 Tax=Massiliimalia timonensis TaxID=1987501 RepID=A0A8J6PD79_9FIRM|nr:anaerobic ribonucleoside-triphosphate reductase [Massiliimalia timonensis]MBC8610351.1 ribonucleoside-triphosphate reductase [Massiliimalia timonensis]MBS7174589.1 ribonucleoside-triphosphate reductase [Clostridiales bacterium]SCH63077.1 anaerobic ribonucleoside triphosphate reductase [uncultured Clostridium sp.]SCH77731.1 anaerobic ribonucleoside triphosphate reductase [uncultured Ruminococcus sp.]
MNGTLKVVNGKVGEGVGFERIRRITGYLVGTVDRFNNGKRAEEHDRVKHSLNTEQERI